MNIEADCKIKHMEYKTMHPENNSVTFNEMAIRVAKVLTGMFHTSHSSEPDEHTLDSNHLQRTRCALAHSQHLGTSFSAYRSTENSVQ